MKLKKMQMAAMANGIMKIKKRVGVLERWMDSLEYRVCHLEQQFIDFRENNRNNFIEVRGEREYLLKRFEYWLLQSKICSMMCQSWLVAWM